MEVRYRPNEPEVSYESFDDEILVINLKNGNYYSLLGSAIPVWLLVVAGASAGEASDILARGCRADPVTVAASVADFVAMLARENLLVPLPAGAAPANLPAVPLPATFSPPELSRYTDMQQLLLMDPIHEVDSTGWPTTRNPEQDRP